MPLTSRGSASFLRTLSDFWVEFFKDTKTLNALMEGHALSAAQVYQQFLETVLGTSLKDTPLFDKLFYAAITLNEGDLRYVEGPSSTDDRYELPAGLRAAKIPYLQNRILEPTAFLTEGREYEVSEGVFSFSSNPFEDLTLFPVRHVEENVPAQWTDPLGRAWGPVEPGDSVRINSGQASDIFTLTGNAGATLYLDAQTATLRQSLVRRGGGVLVTRVPYDETQVGKLLSDHPQSVTRLTDASYDGVTIDASHDVDLSGASMYSGAWFSSTAYSVGSLVDHVGSVWYSLVAHTSGLAFDATLWANLGAEYAHVAVLTDPQFDGVFALSPSGVPGHLTLATPVTFSSGMAVRLSHVVYSTTLSTPRPVLTVPHSHLKNVTLNARRAVEQRVFDSAGVLHVYPAFESVLPGVDYLLDTETGAFTILSAWDPALEARAGYTWALEIVSRRHAWRGAYNPASVPYTTGDLLTHTGATFIVRTDHVSDGSFDDARYAPYVDPLKFDATRTLREIAMWGADALVDTDKLYENFGYLLDRPHATSEAYRSFLQAVSRLFLMGPTFERVESALNTVAGLPVVRNEGEILTGYASGVDASGSGAHLYGLSQGSDGVLVAATGRFLATTTRPFLSDDVGASITVVEGERARTYVVVAVLSDREVAVSPLPLADVSNLSWHFTHVIRRDRASIPTGAYRFSDADVGASIRFPSAREAKNAYTFRIVSVDDATTAVVETEYGLADEGPVAWEISHSGEQTVTTNRQIYRFALDVPVREDVKASSSYGVLTFHIFESLTTAFSVVDYLEDSKWWHHVQIPEALFPTSGLRRTVTTELVEHVYKALDGPLYGDPGLGYGVDDEERTGQRRSGAAVWFGGDCVQLAFTPGTPSARARDVGQYLVVRTDPFTASYRIAGVEADGVTLHLEAFPPASARGARAPLTLQVELPPLLYRRTIAFVLMDRALKYHCVQVRVDPRVQLTIELLEDTAKLIRAAKPSHTFVFFETGTTFQEELLTEDSISVDFNFSMPEPVRMGGNEARYFPDGLLRYGDCYTYVARTTSITPTPGSSTTLPTTLPVDLTAVRTLVKVRIDPAARVGSRQPAEGVDYDVLYESGKIVIRDGVTITPSPVTVYYVDCIRRVKGPLDALDPGETRVVYGGEDPTFYHAEGQTPDTSGLVDRAIQLTLGP